MKLNAEKVEEFVRKAVAEGAVQAADIYAKAMEYYKNEIKTKKCEDLLSVSVSHSNFVSYCCINSPTWTSRICIKVVKRSRASLIRKLQAKHL